MLRAKDIPLLEISLLKRVDRKTHCPFFPTALTWLYSGKPRNLIDRATLFTKGDTVDLKNLTEMADNIPVSEIDIS